MTNCRRGSRVGGVWLPILVSILCGAGLAAAAWFCLPPRYESFATLLVHNQPPAILHSEGSVDFQTVKNNTMAMLQSVIVAQKALDDPAVRELPIVKKQGIDAADWLSDSLTVENPAGGEVIRVSLVSENREGLDKIVNAVVSAYMLAVVEKERTERLVHRDNINKKLLLYKNNLMSKRRDLFELGQQLNASDAKTANATIQIEVDALQELMRRRVELLKKLGDGQTRKELVAAMPAAADGDSADFMVENERIIAHDPKIIQATKEHDELGRKLRGAQESKPPAADSVINGIRDQISSVEQQIDQMCADDRQAFVDKLNEKSQHAASEKKSELKALDVQIAVFQKEIEKVTEQIRKQAENVQKLVRFNGDAEQLQTDIDERKGLIHDMETTLEHWNIELDAEPRVERQQPATEARPIEPMRQPIEAALGGLAGFSLAMVFAVLVHLLRK